ncbi:unnamed protein product [Effrenium voratum]|nr:unnamed protein product [Effrenium voratum]
MGEPISGRNSTASSGLTEEEVPESAWRKPGKAGLAAPRRARIQTGQMSPVLAELRKSALAERFLGTTQNRSEAWLAREMGLPLHVLQQSLAFFKKHCPEYDGKNLFDITFDMTNFAEMLCEMTGVDTVEQLDRRFVSEAFRQADYDRSGGIDCKEFVMWYAAFGFSNFLCVKKEDLPYRNLARKLGLNLLELERYKEAFEKFDQDGSGAIDMDEFEELLHVIMKVPTGHHLSAERVMVLWRDADREGEGELDLEAFCRFCTRHLEQGSNNAKISFSEYYRSIRRIPTAPGHL